MGWLLKMFFVILCKRIYWRHLKRIVIEPSIPQNGDWILKTHSTICGRRWRKRSDDLRSLATTTIRDRRFFSLRSWSLMGLNDPWSLKITICGNDLLFTIVINDHDQRSTICEKDGFNGLRAWGRSSGWVIMSTTQPVFENYLGFFSYSMYGLHWQE